MNEFKKRRLVLKQQLIGAAALDPDYGDTLAIFELAERYHTGTRKDGVTPEFDHQVSIALYVLTLPDLIDRPGTIATIMAHDLGEDYGVGKAEIVAVCQNKEFGNRVATSADLMWKVFRGEKRDEKQLFLLMASDPRASIAKGADRMHNFQSMIGVFTAEKQVSYIEYGEVKILPMLKLARQKFPQQVRAYEALKHMLTSQIELLRAGLEARTAKA